MWRIALHLLIAETSSPHTTIANTMADFEKTSSSSELFNASEGIVCRIGR